VIERSVCREVFEEVNGETVQVKPGRGNQMVGATIGVIWSDIEVTMNQVVRQGASEEDRVVIHLCDSFVHCPEGRTMEYITNAAHWGLIKAPTLYATPDGVRR
jgi:hypothetical protein